MSIFIQALVIMFSWLPSWASIVVLSVLALVAVLIVFKVVTFVIDAIPFL